MTKYREILRLLSLGISERKIADRCRVSHNTVSRICKRADETGLKWPLDASQMDKVLEARLYPKETVPTTLKRMPDYEYIRKELLKNGVTQKLLWTEYLEECRQSGENPLIAFSVLLSHPAEWTETACHHAYSQKAGRTDRGRLGR